MLLSRDNNKLVLIKIKGRKMMFVKRIFCIVSSLFVFFNVTGLQSITPEELKNARLKKTSLNQTRNNMNTFESSLQKTLEQRRFAVQGSDDDQDDSWDDDTLSPKQQTMHDKLNQARAEQLQEQAEQELEEDEDLYWDDDENAELKQEEEIIFPPAPQAPFEVVEPVKVIEVSNGSAEKAIIALPEPPSVNQVIFEPNATEEEERLALVAAVLMEQQAQKDSVTDTADTVIKNVERKPVHHKQPTSTQLPKIKFYETVKTAPIQRAPVNRTPKI